MAEIHSTAALPPTPPFRFLCTVEITETKNVYNKSANLKAWMTTVPNKMNKAEKMRDRRGIISRLQVINETQCIYIANVYSSISERESTGCTVCKLNTAVVAVQNFNNFCSWKIKFALLTSCYAEYHQWLQRGNRKMHRSIGLQTSTEQKH